MRAVRPGGSERLIFLSVKGENPPCKPKVRGRVLFANPIKWIFVLTLLVQGAQAEEKTYSFGVLNQRSVTLTAQYWNPILKYVSERSGVPLQLKMGKTAPETSAMTGRGEFDFLYSNHIFTPANQPAGYRVFARPMESAIRGQIVTLVDSPIHAIHELAGREVGFPSAAAFVGYAVPMNALMQAGIAVKPVFAGNQEGIMGQLKAGRVIAAAVNSELMEDYAKREGFKYRVLWSSESYLNLPVSAHPSVPQEKIWAVREALLRMAGDPAGMKILEASAALVKQDPPYGFVAADDRDYENYLKYYRTTLIK